MDETGPLAFTLLGPLRARRGRTELPLAGPQQQAVLAMLLLAEGQPVATEELIDGLWGADCPKAATTTVRTYVSRIRTVLEPGHRGAEGPGLLVSGASAYALRLPADSVDVTLAEQEVTAAAQARNADDPARAQVLLRRALGRWHGIPLAGLTGPFADTWRERLTQRWLTALEARVELDLAVGDAGSAVTDLASAITGHPLRESLRLLSMRALYQCGRQVEALQVFRDTRTVLIRELGIDPDPRLRELHERILRSDPDLLLSPADEPGTPPRSAPPPAQLPADIADFTGRKHLVADLTERLTRQAGTAVRICAISGIGGTGKTALAVHVAHRLRAWFPAGQLFVDLAGVTEKPAVPRIVLGHLLHALGVPDAGMPDDLDARAALYRTMLSEQRMLVVLDNAADGEQIRRLLPGYPGCAVIVTSRARLTAVPAHTVELDSFGPEEARDLLAAVVGGEKVRAESVAARDLVATCGHLPLAVRIAACRVLARPGTTIADCLRELSDERRRLDRLRTGELNVQACFRLGYEQLTPAAAGAFRLLALPDTETISLPIAAALLGLDEFDTEQVLDELINTGLLQSPRSARYRYHDLLRLFARGLRAATDPEDRATAALANLLGFLRATTYHAYRAVRPGHRIAALLNPAGTAGVECADAQAAHDWFDRERDTVLPVLRQAVLRSPALVAPAADVLLGLEPLLERAYAWRDIVELGQDVVDRAKSADLPHAEAIARYLLSGAFWQLSRFTEGADHIERALELCERHDQPLVLAEVRTVRALLVAGHRGHSGRTVGLLREAVEFQRTIGNPSGEANTLGSLAHSYITLGEPALAVDATTAGLELYRSLGDRMGEAQILIQRGGALRLMGDTETAMDCYAQSLGLSRELGLRFLEASLLHRIAETCLIRDDARAAVAVAEKARTLSGEIGLARIEARALTTLGGAWTVLGRSDRALACLDEAVAICRRLGLVEGAQAEKALTALASRATGPDARRPSPPPPGEGV
ncbi:BTAD domain-containing putative transcriptional regulator [Streptomyces sp. NPDC020965]|uniref:AfsR/SARP family transcriptional regulator n=1 Tax=Streptomyces sp. NPDC020965 TaxID=3365105 RepID=UPI0037A7807E